MRPLGVATALGCVFICTAPALAQAQTGTQSASKACDNPQKHQLDFWIGEWLVFNTSDNVQYGTSVITPVQSGCALEENYRSPAAPGGPYSGTSYSAFDANEGKWHQMYVDTNGGVNWYTGALEGRDISLIAPGKPGVLIKMIYSPQPDGSVRQIGSTSKDAGNSWQPNYDYTYRRAANAAAPSRPTKETPVDLTFLEGDWVIADSAGKSVGNSHVSVDLPGSFVSEVRTDESGALPVWFLSTEAGRGWSQFFPSPTGALREFKPVSRPGVWPLVLGGDAILRDGRKANFRLTLTREAGDSSHRQLEMSVDGAITWQTIFDYHYMRAKR